MDWSIADYSTIPDDNTLINGINIAEGCAPSGINNAIRQMMADQASGPVKYGVMPYSELIDYPLNALTMGSDGLLYQASQPSGPAEAAGPQDPVSSTGYWQALPTTAQIFGIGQTWQDMTASRAGNINYTNSTGKPIAIQINAILSQGGAAYLFVNGTALSAFSINTLSSPWSTTVSGIVPAGVVYSFDSTGAPTINFWKELR